MFIGFFVKRIEEEPAFTTTTVGGWGCGGYPAGGYWAGGGPAGGYWAGGGPAGGYWGAGGSCPIGG